MSKLIALDANPNDPKLRAALLESMTPETMAAFKAGLPIAISTFRSIADAMEEVQTQLADAKTDDERIAALLKLTATVMSLEEKLSVTLSSLASEMPW